MSRRLRLLSLLLVVVISTLVPSAAAGVQTSFPDVPVEQRATIQLLSELGIMRGYQDGLFGFYDYFTREQLATVVVRLLRLDSSAQQAMGQRADMYVDSPPASHWSNGYLITAFDHGLMVGWQGPQGRVFDPLGRVAFRQVILGHVVTDFWATPAWLAN